MRNSGSRHFASDVGAFWGGFWVWGFRARDFFCGFGFEFEGPPTPPQVQGSVLCLLRLRGLNLRGLMYASSPAPNHTE